MNQESAPTLEQRAVSGYARELMQATNRAIFAEARVEELHNEVNELRQQNEELHDMAFPDAEDDGREATE